MMKPLTNLLTQRETLSNKIWLMTSKTTARNYLSTKSHLTHIFLQKRHKFTVRKHMMIIGRELTKVQWNQEINYRPSRLLTLYSVMFSIKLSSIRRLLSSPRLWDSYKGWSTDIQISMRLDLLQGRDLNRKLNSKMRIKKILHKTNNKSSLQTNSFQNFKISKKSMSL